MPGRMAISRATPKTRKTSSIWSATVPPRQHCHAGITNRKTSPRSACIQKTGEPQSRVRRFLIPVWSSRIFLFFDPPLW